MGASISPPAGACLVTGCAGFVGGHLTEALLALGAEVVGVDNLSSGRRENMEGFLNHPKFHFLKRDILETDWLDEARRTLPHFRCVFHLAAVVSVAYSMNHETETLETNYKASIELYNQTVNDGARSFVFAGSAAEYGDEACLPIKEEYADNRTIQLSPYGRSKYLASRHIIEAGVGCSLRCFNIYGPRQDPSSPYSGVISRFLLQAARQESLTILGAGDQTRDFIYVSDVVRAYLLAAGLGSAADTPLVGAFNVGSGGRLSIQELASAVNKITGNPAGMTHLPPRPGDVLHSLADVSKLEQATGFKTQTTLETGLKETWRAQGSPGE